MKKEVLNDAIVSFADGLVWAKPLIEARPDDVITRALAIEPAVLGVAANLGKRACERLEKQGVSEAQAAYVFTQICLASAISIELMKKGNEALFRDFLDDPQPHRKENDDE